MGEWRTFKTAPRDGRPFLARYQWLGEYRYIVIRRAKEGPWWLRDDGGPVVERDNEPKDMFRNMGFTHWQPLPSPPEDS